MSFRESGEERRMEADYLVSCVSAVVLRQIPVIAGLAGKQDAS